MASIKSSELITNEDGSIFHLHLLPEDLADDIILVGDPGRVETIASHFQQTYRQGWSCDCSHSPIHPASDSAWHDR